MPEQLPASHHDARRSRPQTPEEQDAEFESRHLRYVETKLRPGGELSFKPFYTLSETQRVAAYIRTSATSRGDVDALQIEDVRGYRADRDGSKWAYGQPLPADTKYLLVNASQVEQQQNNPDGESPRGFVALTAGQTYDYGRDTESKESFVMGTGTSRNHFQVRVSKGGGEITLQDLDSTHGLAIMEQTMVSSDGTPIRQVGDYVFDPRDVTSIDATLQQIDRTPTTDERKAAARELVASGTLGGKSIDYRPVTRKASAGLEARKYVADVALRHVEIAEILVENEIVGFHGSRSVAIPGIARLGLQSAAALRDNGEPVLSGEHFFQYDNGQTSTSFSALSGASIAMNEYANVNGSFERSLDQVKQDLMERANEAQRYASRSEGKRRTLFEVLAREYREAIVKVDQDPDSIEVQMMQYDFPVIIGVSRATVDARAAEQRISLLEGNKTKGEFRLDTSKPIPAEGLPVMAVPLRYVEWVSELMRYYGHESVNVIPIETL